MTRTPEHSETCRKKGRGRAKGSLDLIEAMRSAAEAAQPITGRGIGYKLFTAGLIPSMSRADMQRDLVEPRGVRALRRAILPARLLGSAAAACRGVVGKGDGTRRARARARQVCSRLSGHARVLKRDQRP